MPGTGTVFITGATGFIGRRIANALLDRGHSVRCLVRNSSRARDLEQRGATLVQGDITDDIALDRGLTGADLACHLAACYEIGVIDRGAMERVNVDGTRAFLRIARHHGVPRALYASTTIVLPPAPTPEPIDAARETDRPLPTAYQRTKARAHTLAREAQEQGMPVIIAAPANVYGPGDQGPLGLFTRELIARRLPALLSKPAWYSFVHVDDVVQGMLAAIDQGSSTGIYVLAGEPASTNDYAERVCALAGVKPPPLRLPPALVRLSALPVDAFSRLTGFRTSISRENADLNAGLYFLHSHDRATRELGYRPRPLADGLPETVAWFRTHR